jgi:RNA polymerase sigma-70 factor (ECF subfamily)
MNVLIGQPLATDTRMIPMIVLPDLATEDHLLAQARGGDQMAIMRIYDAYFSAVYQYIRLRVGEPMTAEDLAADVFVKLIQALRGANPPRDSLRGWLFRVARGIIADHYGSEAKMPQTTLEDWVSAPSDEQPEVSFLQRVSAQRAQNAMRMLAADQQEVLVLRFGQQLSIQETADIMGKSASAIKSLQWRAVETLRRLLADTPMEESA